MNTLKSLLGFVVSLGFVALFFWLSGPGLLRDWGLRNDYELVAAEVDGSCRTRALVFTSCSIDIATPQARLDESLLFIDFSPDGYDVSAVAARSDPSAISSTLGVEKFWNRLLTFLGAVALFGFAALTFIGKVFKREPDPAPVP